MEQAVKAYYDLLEDCKDEPLWVRKIEEEIGQNIAYLYVNFDESVRDSLVARSELLNRFDLEKQKFFK